MSFIARFVCLLVFPISCNAALAEIHESNAAGVAIGHIHFAVADVAACRKIWRDFGASEGTLGKQTLLGFPGVYILVRKSDAAGPSGGSAADHVAFSVRDLAAYRQKLVSHAAKIVTDDEEAGVILGELPGGIRVEFRRNATQEHEIQFHHVHLAAVEPDKLRAWYVAALGAEPSARESMLSALVPGGRVDFLMTDAAPAATRGRAIDHIGFEVDDLEAFAARLRAQGITLDRDPELVPELGLMVASLTDPAGTAIELTQGLRGK